MCNTEATPGLVPAFSFGTPIWLPPYNSRPTAATHNAPRTAHVQRQGRHPFNAVTHGMTAKVIVLPHESAPDYHEIRAALIHDYAPATSQELMLVDQIAAGYWRTIIRARRFETAMSITSYGPRSTSTTWIRARVSEMTRDAP